jgi:diguanylate cyclase (GGDEF)-like protein/PAS domain S-box-containing protein
MTHPYTRILVVDDDPAARLLMRASLVKSGFEVFLAENGENALRQFRAQPCDLVMLDVEMPGLNGYQVCAQLRNEVGDELPIVMVTGMDDLESIERAFDAGATDFISKPINWALIGHRARYLLRAYLVQQYLHAAHARNSAILNAIPDTLLRMDAGGQILEVRFGEHANECLQLPRPGHPLAESFPADVAGQILATAAHASETGVAENLDIKLAGRADEERDYEARLVSIDGRETLCLVRDISERKRVEEALRTSEKSLEEAQVIAGLGSYVLNIRTGGWRSSEGLDRLFGIDEGYDSTLSGWAALVHPDDRATMMAYLTEEVLGKGRAFNKEYRIVRQSDQTERWVHGLGRLEFDAQQLPVRMVGTIQDITERKLQELRIVATQNKLQATLDAIPDLMFEVDLDGRYLDYHSPRRELLAAPPEMFLGRTVEEILPPEAAAICMSALREAHEQGRSAGKQFELPLPQGPHWFELSVSSKTDDSLQEPRFIVLSRDITERKEAETKVYRLAYFDTLTGLPNRLSFSERLEREIQRARYQNGNLAVLFMDLDGFKNVNDTLGHGAGDVLLQWVADRLRQGVRPADLVARNDPAGVETDLARLGGDEFTVLIPQLQHEEAALAVAHRIHELMRRPFALEGREVVLTTSIGIAVFPDDGEDAATLLKHADTAMYHAKDLGRDNCQFYSASLTQEAMRRLNLESNLRLALERGEFYLVYQPQLDIASGRIRSLEALIRWNHPELGLISPLEFIPVAEVNGLIVSIGDWVLRTACSDAARWQAAGHPLRVAVNLSAVQFKNPDLVGRVKAIMADTGIAPQWLELELTEGALMEDSAATLATLNALREIGLQLSLDDFGTGYSSLNYLKRMPLNNLKVDQSFVRGLPADKESLAIVRAIVSLAKNLGFTLTAEGIETLEQARILSGLACETLQGYYISKPVPAGEIPAMLERHWTLDEAPCAESQPGSRQT